MDHSFPCGAIYVEGPCPTLSRGPKGGPRDKVFRMANVVGLYPTNVGVRGCGETPVLIV